MSTFSPSNLHIAVLRGGPSREYDLSLRSGASALKHLQEHHRVRDIYIDKRGRWHSGGIRRKVDEALSHSDIAFNMLHGDYGEDGEAQKILSQFGIPYTASGASPSALAYNKVQSKVLAEKEGVPSPHSLTVSFGDDEHIEKEALRIFRSMPLPLIIKPVVGGASDGIAVAHNFTSLSLGLEMSLRHADRVLVEEYIQGVLVSIGVIEDFRDQDRYVLLPIEIRFSPDVFFLDYRNKKEQRMLVPRHIPHSLIKRAEEYTRRIHDGLGLRHYSRAEFIISPTRGVYFIETHSHPDLSEDSPFMYALNEGGVEQSHFFSHLVSLAHKKRP